MNWYLLISKQWTNKWLTLQVFTGRKVQVFLRVKGKIWCVCSVKTVWSMPECFRDELLRMGRCTNISSFLQYLCVFCCKTSNWTNLCIARSPRQECRAYCSVDDETLQRLVHCLALCQVVCSKHTDIQLATSAAFVSGVYLLSILLILQH